MARSRFDDINLSEATFSNVDLHGARFTNINLADATIDDARITGLTIFGHDIETLIANRYAASTVSRVDGTASMVAEPQLFVRDIAAACEFYVDKLGFDLVFSHGEPAFYAQVVRGGWRLNLRLVRGPVFNGGFRDREADALSATLILGDAGPLFEEFEAAGIVFHQLLKREPWGAFTFIVRDADGNLIAFAGRAASSAHEDAPEADPLEKSRVATQNNQTLGRRERR